jgi:hypothetical protein
MRNALLLFVAFMAGCTSTHYFWFTGRFTFAEKEIKWERNHER